ncbi:ArsR/SmtB family transcription factor [Candidatus Eisenbacteria bacterium]|uniref:ArsR/SmtB family transcription factor n=1 Tax=Eiseniibacteriota bacterium TaxID=2212470 RepID=A0ABV6YPQ7_UNCEI
MREFLTIAKALSDENRVRTLMFLRGGELCVCQLIEMLGLAPSTVSKHMATLHGAGLVEARKEGRWMFYRLPDKTSSTAAAAALKWVQKSLAGDGQVQEDATRLKTVKITPVKELCRHYKS